MKLKLLTFYSDSHEKLYNDYFLKSYNDHLTDSFELITKKIDQVANNGEYFADGWLPTMIHKIQLIIDNIEVGNPDPLVYADCDVFFYKDFKNDILQELGDFDIKFQNDRVCRCAGFFIARQTQEVKDFFQKVLDTDLTINEDQAMINKILNSKEGNVKDGLLSWNKYYTVAYGVGGQWRGQQFDPPQTILVHHANWTIGIDNKIKLIEYIKNKIT